MVDWYGEATKQKPKAPTSEGGRDWFGEATQGATPSPSQFQGPRVIGQEGGAPVSDVAIASLAEETPSRIRYYSQAMGIPEERFGVAQGQLVYADPQGNLQAVEPGFMRQFARGLGPSFPAVAGAGGSILGGLAGAGAFGAGAVPGAAAGGVAGAASGQALRDLIAKQVMDQPLDPVRPIREGAFDLGATVAGLMVGKGVSRVVATKAAQELNRQVLQQGRNAMDALSDTLARVNKEYGTNIRLTPAEVSNAAKLRSQQMALEARPTVSQRLEDFYASRGAQADKAMQGYLEGLSSQASPEAAGEGLQSSADLALNMLKKQRATQGSPVYQEAFREAGFVDTAPVMREIDNQLKFAGPELKRALNKTKRLMQETYTTAEGKTVSEPIGDLEVLQNRVKETLDDEVGALYRAGRTKAANRLSEVQTTLLDVADTASSKYAEARKLWGDLSDPISRAKGGILPGLAGKTQKDFEYMGGRFLSSASPGEIGRARDLISKTEGGPANWDATLRGYLSQRWENAGRVFKSQIARPSLGKAAQPSTFWAEMVGNPEQQRRLQAAMSPRQWTAFKNLMDVFEASGRATNYNSTTAAQLQGQELLDATGKGASLYRSAVNPFGVPARMEGWIADTVTDANLQRIVDVITTKESVDELLKISTLRTGRDRGLLLAAKAMNLARANVMADEGPDMLPPVMKDLQRRSALQKRSRVSGILDGIMAPNRPAIPGPMNRRLVTGG